MGFNFKKATGIKIDSKSLGNVGKNLTGYMGQALGGPIGQKIGGYVGDAYFGSGPKPPSGGEDPNVTALRNKLFGEAQDFEKSLPGLQSQAGNQIEAEGDMALQSGLKGTKQNFNRRGLLYSGLREAGEQSVRGKVASTMAGQKAEANQDLRKMATAKATKAAQVGLQGYQDSVNREAEIAGISLKNQVARAQAMQQLGQTGGYIAGSMYGNRQPGTSTYSSGINSSYTPNFSNDYRSGNLRADTDYYNTQRIAD